MNIGLVRIHKGHISNVAGFIIAIVHLKTRPHYAAQIGIVGDHLRTFRLPRKEICHSGKIAILGLTIPICHSLGEIRETLFYVKDAGVPLSDDGPDEEKS